MADETRRRTLRRLRLAGGLAALPLCILLLGFFAGRAGQWALDAGWVGEQSLDLTRAPAEQVERKLGARLDPNAVLNVKGSALRFESDEWASVIEILAARGKADLVEYVSSDWANLAPEQIDAAICAAARYGHGSVLQVLLSVPTAKPDGLLCRPEAEKPSRLARENGHGGASERLAERGF